MTRHSSPLYSLLFPTVTHFKIYSHCGLLLTSRVFPIATMKSKKASRPALCPGEPSCTCNQSKNDLLVTQGNKRFVTMSLSFSVNESSDIECNTALRLMVYSHWLGPEPVLYRMFHITQESGPENHIFSIFYWKTQMISECKYYT